MTDDRSEEERLNDQEKRAHDELHRAQRAKQIIEDELFVAAVEATKERIWDDFAKSKLQDDVTRRDARISLHVLDGILKNLRHHMETGKLASATLKEVKQRRDWLARFRRPAA